MSSRFDYIAYDEKSQKIQADFKADVISLESMINGRIKCPVSRHEAIKNLELVYMWIGKGIRNDQIQRDANFKLQEGRGLS